MRVFYCHSVFISWTVEGSASWRIPLGAQLIPGITLAIGCIFLPPSPRLLVAQGRNDEALKTLAKLRLRSEHEVQDDPLLQVSIGCLAFCYLLLVHIIPRSYVFTFLLSCHPLYCHCLESVWVSRGERSLSVSFHILLSAWLFSWPTRF